MTEKIPTGIKGFDRLVQGGLPKGKQILLTGTPGTGKTIFCLEYIFNGAAAYGQKGLFVSIEEEADSLRDQAKQFGWDFEAYEKKGLIKVMCISAADVSEATLSKIIAYVKENNVDRLVIDSLTALAINVPASHVSISDLTDIYIKRFIYQFICRLQSIRNVTTLLISQSAQDAISMDGVSEYVCDGIVKIDYESLGGEYSRSLSVRKMRQVKNEEDVYPMQISDQGIVVHQLD